MYDTIDTNWDGAKGISYFRIYHNIISINNIEDNTRTSRRKNLLSINVWNVVFSGEALICHCSTTKKTQILIIKIIRQ